VKTCSVCSHAQRETIDEALLLGSDRLRAIAARWAVSKTALIRHKAEHLPASLRKAKEAAEGLHADSLLDRLHQVTVETQAVLAQARAAKDHDLVLRCVARLEKQIELEARLLGELKDHVQSGPVQITVTYVDKALMVPPERMIE
jgi:hypothetical protein